MPCLNGLLRPPLRYPCIPTIWSWSWPRYVEGVFRQSNRLTNPPRFEHHSTIVGQFCRSVRNHGNSSRIVAKDRLWCSGFQGSKDQRLGRERLDRVHNRYLKSIKSLATVLKMALPTLIALQADIRGNVTITSASQVH